MEFVEVDKYTKNIYFTMFITEELLQEWRFKLCGAQLSEINKF